MEMNRPRLTPPGGWGGVGDGERLSRDSGDKGGRDGEDATTEHGKGEGVKRTSDR